MGNINRLPSHPCVLICRARDLVVRRYGYLTLFAVAFPLVAALALLNNLVEIRSDSGKLCASFRRPIPYGACDIGAMLRLVVIFCIS